MTEPQADRHLDDDLEDRVLDGSADQATARWSEVHLPGCAACRARLARAAEVELLLLAAGPSGGLPATTESRPVPLAPAPGPGARRYRTLAVAGALLASALLLVVVRGRPPGDPVAGRGPEVGNLPIEPLVTPRALAFLGGEEPLELPTTTQLAGFIPGAEP
jgi:hypothetical protein